MIKDYPFNSPDFEKEWQTWKQYKKEQFKYIYKPISEKAALTHLLTVSKGQEHIAIKIIQQSIANGWKGFFELKQQSNGTTKDKNAGRDDLFNRFKAIINVRGE